MKILRHSTQPSRRTTTARAVDQERAKIDRLDERILVLLNRRARIAKRIGHQKCRSGTNVAEGFWVPSREKRILDRLRSLNTGPLSDESVRAIFREIISASRALEATIAVAYLGPEGTFAHAAAREKFGAGVALTPVESIPQVFSEVEQRRADFGIVPVENSTEGSVTSTLDLLIDSPLQVAGEVMLKVRQCLLSAAPSLASIRRVLSHPQGLAQCRRWLARHLPQVELEEVASTSRAAEVAQGDATAAAIASRMAGERYQLGVLAADIQDERSNVTRFFVLGACDAQAPSGADKTSVVCSVKDEVGILARLLRPLAREGISLQKIESRPLRGRPWQYVFFLDLRGHRSDAKVKRALARMAPFTTFLKILGSYPAGG